MKNNRNSEENNAPRACKIIDKRKLQFVYGNQAQQVNLFSYSYILYHLLTHNLSLAGDDSTEEGNRSLASC